MEDDAHRLAQCHGATFHRLMSQVLTSITTKYGNLMMCYMNDVVIATPTLADHIDRLDEVFDCMKRAGLKCKPSKCEIIRYSIKYLGRIIDRHGVRSHPEAVEAVLTWKAPRADTQLMSFLDLPINRSSNGRKELKTPSRL